MKIIRLSKALFATVLGFIAFAGQAKADVTIQAKVLSTTVATSTVQFTFSGSIPTTLSTPPNLTNFLFLDISTSTGLQAGLATSSDYSIFNTNTASTNTGSTVTTVEIRNNEPYYFNRLSFIFTQAFTTSSSFSANSVVEITLPTSTPLQTSDFANLNIYWGFPAFGTANGRTTPCGLVNPPSASPTPAIAITVNASSQTVITFTGTLESSPDLSTPFAAVTGAVSPYTVPSSTPTKLFYRASVTQ